MRVTVRDGGELQRWLLAVRITNLCILDAGQVVILLPRNHEGRQVSCVYGQEDHSKKCPDTGHEPIMIMNLVGGENKQLATLPLVLEDSQPEPMLEIVLPIPANKCGIRRTCAREEMGTPEGHNVMNFQFLLKLSGCNLHSMTCRGKPLKQKNGKCSSLNGHQRDKHPRTGVKRF